MIESIFTYSLRSSLVLAMLYVPYMLMLRQESFFRLNRMMLLLILLLSLTLPMLDVHSLAWEGFAPVQTVLRPALSENGASVHAILLPEVAVRATGDTSSAFGSRHYVSVSYVVMMLSVFLWHVYQVVQMRVVMRRGSLWQQTRDGVRIYCHADEVSPYSWMNRVVISEQDYRENGREILLHEMAHVRARHSWDLLVLALVQTLQWWNPLVYILGGSMRDVHEYQADESVLRHGVSAKEYQLLLIKKVVGSSSYAFANNFDHSLIIKRITMMQKSKSSKWMYGKALYILPMATLALSAFASVQSVTSSDSVAMGKVTKKMPVATSKSVKINGATIKNFSLATDSLVVYEVDGRKLSADEFAKLSVSDVKSVTVLRGAKAAPDGTRIIIATANGKADDAVYEADSTSRIAWAKVSFCETPSHLPQFPGGETAMQEFIRNTVRYPAEAMSAGVQGRVAVEFFVKDDGSIGTVGLIRPVSFAGCRPKGDAALCDVAVADYVEKCLSQGKKLSAEEEAAYRAGVEAILNEAVRVVSKMPDWTPGYVDKEKTKPCNTRFVLPVSFRLE
ncbi:MAG: M56 family metallopeptidase [Paraprevotella sp.]|nr:M56 family metallopeptidase [Paraprevotella sp.]